MKLKRDLTGRRFGRLIVLRHIGSDTRYRALYLAQCDCGSKPFSVRGDGLEYGSTKSCGCLHREIINTHKPIRYDIDAVTGCWNCISHKGDSNYPSVMINYRNVKVSHVMFKEKYSTQLIDGRIPTGKIICHKCDNPRCINPDHLFLGSQADNMQDKVTKLRQAKGSDIGISKLKEDDVAFIRRNYQYSSSYKLAKLLGVNAVSIQRVIRGDTWKHVTANSSQYMTGSCVVNGYLQDSDMDITWSSDDELIKLGYKKLT